MAEPPRKAQPAKPAKPAAPAKPPAAAAPPPPPVTNKPKSMMDDDDDGVVSYGVLKESEEELKLIEKNKPTFGAVQDKFKRSARGPAQGLLVLPTNLMIAAGAISGIAGVGTIIVGLWPLVFTDAPPSTEEYVEQFVQVFVGLVLLIWASLVCIGASKMQSLESYAWALAGAVLAIPMLAGIFALIAIRDPRVRAGFEEVEGAIDGKGEDDEDKDDEDEDDEDDDD
ncbi:MAG: hypothetical protein ACRC8S_05595 [Fimbriiglobus sp.]